MPDTAPEVSWFLVRSSAFTRLDAVIVPSRLKAELHTGAVSRCARPGVPRTGKLDEARLRGLAFDS